MTGTEFKPKILGFLCKSIFLCLLCMRYSHTALASESIGFLSAALARAPKEKYSTKRNSPSPAHSEVGF